MQGRFQAGLLSAVQQFQKVSPIPKLLCGLFILLYLLGFIPGMEDNLIVTPGFLGPPHAKLWTIITALFYENNFVWVILDIIALVGFSVLLEPLWGLRRYLIFSGLVGCISMIIVVCICILIYVISGSINILFARLHGFIGLVCGYLVGVKQAHPDSVAFPPPAPPTLRVKHLPLLVTFIALLLAVLKLVSFTHSLLAFNGMVVAWVYLRFYEKQEEGTRGDMAESFSFATFFPEILHPSVSALGEGVFRVLVRFKICRNTIKTYDVSGPSTIKISLPGTTTVDAERRKQRALKALDERLSKTSHSQQINWPSLDDNATSSDDQSPSTPAVSTTSTSVPSPPTSTTDTIPEVVVQTSNSPQIERTDNTNNPLSDK